MIIPSSHAIPSPTYNPPTPSLTIPQGSAGVLVTTLGRDGSECTDITRCRTTTNIVLSCLTTIFACTWVALHLDATSSKKGMRKSLWRRVRWMAVAVIAPDVIVMLAMGNLIVSKKYVEDWNTNFAPLCSPKLVEIRGATAEQYEHELKVKQYNSRWTLTHGFLATMHGIKLYNYCNDRPTDSFRPDEEYFKNPKMWPIIQQIGLISQEEIEDKSKGDGISKFFVVIQTTWFIAQCLARWAAHLPVTELEVVTLAYAVLNIFIYALWWKKPQSLSVPYRFYLEKDEEISGVSNSEGGCEEEEHPLITRSLTPNIADEVPNTSPLSGSETINTRTHWGEKQTLLMNEWKEPTHSAFLGFLLTIVDENLAVCVFPAPTGVIFGALHLIPIWLSVFPSGAEKQFWQVSAITITTAPSIFGVCGIFINMYDVDNDAPLSLLGILNRVSFCLLFISAAAYVVARVILLVLTFTALRSLPPEAFLNIEWTRFIPHF